MTLQILIDLQNFGPRSLSGRSSLGLSLSCTTGLVVASKNLAFLRLCLDDLGDVTVFVGARADS
jgi:hypothetical protein